MITIRKLETLPHHTRLRKTVSLLSHIEKREPRVSAHRRYLRDLMQTLIRDRSLPQEIRGIAESLHRRLGSEEVLKDDAYEQRLRRAVNTLRHELNAFLGRSAADWDVYDESDGELDASSRRVCGFYIYLEDLRSPFNVGAVFRAAESFGIKRVFLSPYTADPQHPRARRASMSTVDVLPSERIELTAAVSAAAAAEGFTDAGTFPVFALETGGSAITSFGFPARGLMVIGSEELGVSPAALASADSSAGRVTIETGGVKGSLNVGVASGIALHAWWVGYGLRTIS